MSARLARLAVVLAAMAGCARVAQPPTDRVVDYDAGIPTRTCGVLGSRHLGESCDCTGDCDETAICVTEAAAGVPHGFCSRSCSSDPQCPIGSHCVDKVCLLDCRADLDCPAHNHCYLGSCYPQCESSDECLSGNCNRYSGQCVAAGVVPMGGGIDAPCVLDGDCKSGRCHDGHCWDSCSTDAGACPDQGVCTPFSPLDGGLLGNCTVPCTPPQPCPTADRTCAAYLPGMRPSCLPLPAALGDGGCTGNLGSPTAAHPCGCNADCDPGSVCYPEESYPNLAKGACVQLCSTTSDCPSTDACVDGLTVGLPFSLCDQPCVTEADCQRGLCYFGFCLPFCVDDSDCNNGACNRDTNRCAPAVGGGSLGPGQPCQSNGQCRSDACSTAYDAGMCITLCDTLRGACPDDAICAAFSSSQTDGFCALKCTTKADCPQVDADCVATVGSATLHCQ